MFQSIWQEVRRELQHGNMVTKLLLANLAVFLFFGIARLVLLVPGTSLGTIYSDMLYFFSFSYKPSHFLTHPWSILTNLFVHESIGHIFWNMLSLFWFGRIVGDLLGNHRVLPIYLMGGVVANLFYLLAAYFSPYAIGDYAIGASGCVMAMVVCAAVIAPDYEIGLLFLGPVKLKFVALALVVIDLFALPNNVNAGGLFAHLGGALFGGFFANQLQKGTDLGAPLNRFFEWIKNWQSGKKKPKFTHTRGGSDRKTEKTYAKTTFSGQAKGQKKSDESGTPTTDHQKYLDQILDKIKERGYESLTSEERDFLFNASKK
jgi:membrane associated rhomboid family serine protease